MKKILLFLSFSILFFANCRQSNETETTQHPPKQETKIQPPTIQQIIIAYNENPTDQTGKLYGIEWKNEKWDTTFETIPCSFGKKGIAEISQKLEGDGKAPSGVFELGMAFGYQKDIEPQVEFLELRDNHYWISDTISPLYNQLVEEFPKDIYAEKMRRNDHLYKYGLVIEYNTKPVVKNKGSAIFLHIERRKGAPTAGCVAINEEKMKALIEWIKPELKPSILIATQKNIDFNALQIKK